MGFGRVFGTEEARPNWGPSLRGGFSEGALKRNSADRRVFENGFTSRVTLAGHTSAFA